MRRSILIFLLTSMSAYADSPDILVSNLPAVSPKVLHIGAACGEALQKKLHGYGGCASWKIRNFQISNLKLIGEFHRFVAPSCPGVVADITLEIPALIETEDSITIEECKVEKFEITDVYSD